ncbi:MAG: hypothetical protein IPN27_10130 [Cellvibrionales bacterium]|nr:hypothetical protein [Cellvibrionales bacterium]MBK8676717.1 hypothetical protein [Cellvibrionales bacterium]HRF87088.1 hypothetical protein [Pseudomonadales bacterium]HRG50020.1 hypothetical protein [Pseudomonadales bacterium]
MKTLCATIIVGLSSAAFALDASEQRYVEMLSSGSMGSVKAASQDIFNTGEDNPAVLDHLAEVLLQNYANAPNGHIDALSWAAKALGKSRNPRYRDTLNTIASSNANKKLRKYASQALENLSSSGVPQYKRGSVAPVKSSGGRASTSSAQSRSATTTGAGLSAVKIGMSMAEAYALAGEPTSSTGHVTGKAWIPFNFKGSDTLRQYSLYKGKGRIIFTNRSHYDRSWQVYEVQIDTSEPGYP